MQPFINLVAAFLTRFILLTGDRQIAKSFLIYYAKYLLMKVYFVHIHSSRMLTKTAYSLHTHSRCANFGLEKQGTAQQNMTTMFFSGLFQTFTFTAETKKNIP